VSFTAPVLRGVSPATIRNYLLYARKFAAFYRPVPLEQAFKGASVAAANLRQQRLRLGRIRLYLGHVSLPLFIHRSAGNVTAAFAADR
jgi:hypothetical protein